MTAKPLSIITFALIIGFNSLAQDAYQIFKPDGFKVKCDCKLKINSTFIQMAKQQGVTNILASYVCTENDDSPDHGVITNINIYDESKIYEGIQPSYHTYLEKRYIEQYKDRLAQANIKHHSVSTYQGVPAVEYTFEQMGLPTKAIVFLRNQKSYLIQVSTRKNLPEKFNMLKSTFSFL